MKLLKSYKYHIINLMGWLVYILSTLTFDKVSYKLLMEKALNPEEFNALNYFIVEGMLCGLLGFLLSYIILFYFENNINFQKVGIKELITLAVVFLTVNILYNIVLWPILDIPVNYFFPNQELSQPTLTMKFANFPHFFVAFLVWLFVIASIEVFNYLNIVKLNRIQLESSLKESQLNTLKGQINPHFMFNSLNNIRGLILENPQKSREMITKLSEILRFSLIKNDVDVINLDEEIEIVDSFIAISKIQMEERLQFEKDIQPKTLALKIPPMVIQLLIENAIKHGIATIKEGGLVKLTCKIENKNLIIEVSNTGKLVIQLNSTQLGIKNIKDRIFLLYGKSASFQLEELGSNVVAKISLPIQNKDE